MWVIATLEVCSEKGLTILFKNHPYCTFNYPLTSPRFDAVLLVALNAKRGGDPVKIRSKKTDSDNVREILSIAIE